MIYQKKKGKNCINKIILKIMIQKPHQQRKVGKNDIEINGKNNMSKIILKTKKKKKQLMC